MLGSTSAASPSVCFLSLSCIGPAFFATCSLAFDFVAFAVLAAVAAVASIASCYLL